MHQLIRILFLPESHKDLQTTPLRNHQHTDTTPIPRNSQYNPPCCSSPPHQTILKIGYKYCFYRHQILHLFYTVICTLPFFSKFTFIFVHTQHCSQPCVDFIHQITPSTHTTKYLTRTRDLHNCIPSRQLRCASPERHASEEPSNVCCGDSCQRVAVLFLYHRSICQ